MHRFLSLFPLLLLLTASDYTTHYFIWRRRERVYYARRGAYWNAHTCRKQVSFCYLIWACYHIVQVCSNQFIVEMSFRSNFENYIHLFKCYMSNLKRASVCILSFVGSKVSVLWSKVNVRWEQDDQRSEVRKLTEEETGHAISLSLDSHRKRNFSFSFLLLHKKKGGLLFTGHFFSHSSERSGQLRPGRWWQTTPLNA